MEKKNMMGAYQTPEVEVLDVIAEGVLCASGDHGQWATDDDLWS